MSEYACELQAGRVPGARRRPRLTNYIAIAAAGAAAIAGCDAAGGRRADPDAPDTSDVRTGSTGVADADLPVLAETDVLVVGGGPAGLAAAIGSARAGAKTLLVERCGFYGGVITQSIMGSITWYRYAQTQDAGGVCAEIEAKAKAMGGSINLLEVSDDPALRKLLVSVAESSGLAVDGKPTYEILRSELFKVVADALVTDAGVSPLQFRKK